MKKIGILYHPKKETALPIVEKIREFLEKNGVSTWHCSAWEVETAQTKLNGTELILTVGGDGTILRAVQTVVPKPVPITGVNLGNLGFMTELTVDELEPKLLEILAGKGWIDERSLLEAQPVSADGRTGERYFALNDVVVARGEIARVIHIETRIDGELLNTYKADGVIIATATGSTGYSLAANGPILYRQSRELLFVPINPHLSSGYSLVLPDSAIIELKVGTYNSATMSIDGHINATVNNGDSITVKHSNNTVRFLRIHPENAFYSSLEHKLKGKL